MEKFFEGLASFGEFCAKSAALHEEAMTAAAGLAAHVGHEKLSHIMGDPDKLRDLMPVTQAERLRQGYTENNPLLRSGELLDSFEIVHEGMTSGYGTMDPKMIYLELGTPKMAPLPAVEVSLREAEPEIKKLVDAATGIALGAPALIKPL